MRREWTTIKRDVAALRGRFMPKIVMGLIAGSLFFNLSDEQKGMMLKSSRFGRCAHTHRRSAHTHGSPLLFGSFPGVR